MKTKKILLSLALTIASAMTCHVLAQDQAPLPKEEGPVMTQEDGMTVINTTSLAEDVEGYAGPTPLKIFIKKDKVEKIEPLKNLETPKYFALIKRDLLTKWNGLTVKKATQQQVDAITGATYSSEAVIENVRRGLDYYTKKGKK